MFRNHVTCGVGRQEIKDSKEGISGWASSEVKVGRISKGPCTGDPKREAKPKILNPMSGAEATAKDIVVRHNALRIKLRRWNERKNTDRDFNMWASSYLTELEGWEAEICKKETELGGDGDVEYNLDSNPRGPEFAEDFRTQVFARGGIKILKNKYKEKEEYHAL